MPYLDPLQSANGIGTQHPAWWTTKPLCTVLFVISLTSLGLSLHAEEANSRAEATAANSSRDSKDQLAERDRLWEEAQASEHAGKHQQTIELAERVMAIEIEIFGEKNLEITGTLELIARQHMALDELPSAIKALERQSALLAELPDAPSWRLKAAQCDLENVRRFAKLSPEDRAELRRVERLYQAEQFRDDASSSQLDRAKALQDAQEVLAVRERLLGEEHLDTANALDSVAYLLQTQAEYVAAIRYNKRSLAIRRKLLGDENPLVALSLQNLAYCLHASGDFAGAKQNFEEALGIRRRTLGNSHFRTIGTLTKLAILLRDSGDYDNARRYYNEIIEIQRSTHGENHPKTAEAWNNLGIFSRTIGDYDAAQEQYEHALAIQRVTLGEEHPDTTITLCNLGINARLRGDLNEAASLLERALTIQRKTLGAEHSKTIFTLGCLGSVYFWQAQYGRARECFEEELEVKRRLFPPDHLELAGTLENLAYLFEETRDFEQAERLGKQALAIRRKRLGNAHPVTARSLQYHGKRLRAMGRNSEAVACFEESLNIRRAVYGEGHNETMAVCYELALALIDDREYDKAKLYLTQALAAQEKSKVNEQDKAAVLTALGRIHVEMGEYSQARECMEGALALDMRFFGEKSFRVSRSLNNIAVALRKGGPYKESREYFDQAIDSSRQALGETHPLTLQCMVAMGDLLAAMQEHDEAARVILESIRLEQQFLSRELLTMSEAKLESYFSEPMVRFDILASLPLGQLHQEREVAESLLARKAIVLEVLHRRRYAERIAATNPEVAELRRKLSVARQTLEDLLLRPARNMPPQELDDRRDSLRQQCKELEDQYARALGQAATSEWQLKLSLDDIRKRLAPGQHLVDYFKFTRRDFQLTEPSWQEERYAACVIGADASSSVRIVDLGPATEIDELVAGLSSQVREFQTERESADESSYEDDYRQVAGKLYAKIMAPLEDVITGATQIYVSPDSRLHEIPFEALVDTNGRYLIEAGYQFAYVSSGRDLIRPQSTESGSGVLVFAGPNYDLDASGRLAAARHWGEVRADVTALAASEPLPAASAIEASPALRSADSRAGWKYLPGADLEGQEAGTAFTQAGWNGVQVFTGDEAQEDFVKRVRRPRILVLVTHGDFLDDEPARQGTSVSEDRSFGVVSLDAGDAASDRGRTMQARSGLRSIDNPLLRSYLLLAGANKIDERLPEGTQIENGWLTAQEIGDLDLQGTDLVVLSACNTNRGKAANGEAVVGMRSAFLFAGAKTIVGSLYEVPNAETRALLRPFYAGVAVGAGKLASLHSAKLEFIRQRREAVGAAHPFYWASFVLVGAP